MQESKRPPARAPRIRSAARRSAILTALTGITALLLRPAAATPKETPGPVPAPLRAASHKVVILVASNEDRVMGHALAYAFNLNEYYTSKQQPIEIELVANGGGIDLFRADRSPLKDPLAALRAKVPHIVYSACHSSMFNAAAREHHEIALIPNVGIVPFGIGRVVDLQEAGWTCIHA